MMNILKRNWQISLVIALSIGMFFVYAWFSWNVYTLTPFICDAQKLSEIRERDPDLAQLNEQYCAEYGDPKGIIKFNSPDETLNHFWSLREAHGNTLSYEEPLEGIANQLIRPRSVNVLGSTVAPGSFLGLPFIAGTLARALNSIHIDPSLTTMMTTPLIAAIALLFFFLLIRDVFGKNIAVLSTIFAAAFPGLIYFTSRSMFHNVMFVSLCIIGLYWLQHALLNRTPQKRGIQWQQLFYYVLSGLLMGYALITRTSELGWVALLVVVLLAVQFKKIYWPGLILFIGFLIIPFISVFEVNYALYGAPLSIGYSTGISGEFTSVIGQSNLLFKLLISPFGVDLHSMKVNGYEYWIKFFWYFSIPSFLGMVLWVIQRLKKKDLSFKNNEATISNRANMQLVYIICWLCVTAYLLVFYGSWEIVDRIDEQTVSIGTSYIRYWLPIYLGMLPFFAYVLNWLTSYIRRAWARVALMVLIVILLGIQSANTVYWGSDESLTVVRDNVMQSQAKLLRIRNKIEHNAVVVLGFKQADKIFFPEHQRIIPELAVDRDYQAVALIAQHEPMYYYHFADPETAAIISQRYFEPFGIRIDTDHGYKVFQREWLYPIVVTSN